MKSHFATHLEMTAAVQDKPALGGRSDSIAGTFAEGIPRSAEALVAFVGLLAASPLIGVAATAVKLSSRGPVFFRQVRVGKGGTPFTLLKLRTMTVSTSGPQVTKIGDSRITAVGRLLRKTKLDELPQLWNVLRGEMSFVGPRPEVPRYVNLADSTWQRVLQARPGVTDPVTLRLRNEEELLADVRGDVESFYLSTLQPVKLNGYLAYLESRNWSTDLRVVLSTILGVLRPGRTPAPTFEQVKLEAETISRLSRSI